MRPGSPINNKMYSLVSQTKAAGYGCLALAIGGAGSNLHYNLGREFLSISVLRDGMGDVVSVRHPLKIGRDIIASVKVFVVDSWKVVGIWHECLGNKTRDWATSLLPVLAKDEVTVAKFVGRTNNNLPAKFGAELVASFVANKAVDAAHSSKIRNFVKTLVSLDWEPSLSDHVFLHGWHRKCSRWQTMMQG